VATSRIRIAACAVSHGNLTISIASTQDVSQPNPLSQTGATAVHAADRHRRQGGQAGHGVLPDLPSVEKVAAALNALGVSPRDMMSMFQTMNRRRVAGGLERGNVHVISSQFRLQRAGLFSWSGT